MPWINMLVTFWSIPKKKLGEIMKYDEVYNYPNINIHNTYNTTYNIDIQYS